MVPIYYIPLYFNIILFAFGISLTLIIMYFQIVDVFPWYVNIPFIAYGIHFSIFYGLISFAELTGHFLDGETMTIWSAILRFHGIITVISMMFILYLIYGIKKRYGKLKS